MMTTPMSETESDRNARNLFVFIADALRRDYTPESVRRGGTHIDTVADGPKTPINIPSILTGQPPQVHGCESFSEGDRCLAPSVLDLDQEGWDTSFIPGVDQEVLFRLLNNPEPWPLPSMEEPFVFIEHCHATHGIYGQCLDPDCGYQQEGFDPREGEHYSDAREYYLRMKAGNVDHRRDYAMGVTFAAASFLRRVERLAAMDVLDDTFVVFTSDHGEAFPEDGKYDVMHNFSCSQTLDVSTVVWGRDIYPPEEPIMSHEILDLWWPGIADEVLPELEVPDGGGALTPEERAQLNDDLEHLGYR